MRKGRVDDPELPPRGGHEGRAPGGGVAGGAFVIGDVSWTFPPAFAGVVWGDGKTVRRMAYPLDGEGECILSVLGFLDLTVSLGIAGNISGDQVEGDLSVDLGGFYEIDTPITGSFISDSEMEASFSYDGEVTVGGSVSAHRVARMP